MGTEDGIIDFLKVDNGTYEDIACDKAHNGRVNGVCYEPLSNVVYSVSSDKLFRISHGTSLSLILGIPHKEPLMCIVKDPINKRLFISNKIG